MSSKDFLTVEETANYLRMSKSSIYKMVHKETIPFYKPSGGRVLFRREELDAWVVRSATNSMDDRVMEDNTPTTKEALDVAIEVLTPTEEKTPADIKEACSQVSGTPLDYFLAGMSYYKNSIWHGNEDLPEEKEELQEIPVIFVSQFYCDEWLRKGSLINDPDSDDGWIIIDRPTGDNLQMSAVEKWCYAEDINIKVNRV